jgi:hypothetical protein
MNKIGENQLNNNYETVLRAHIKSVINQKLNNTINEIKQENKLRSIVRKLLIEADNPEEDPHEFTGINVLRDLFKSSNILQQMRQAYKTLTTDKSQRDAFRAHIIRWTLDTLNPIEATEKATVAEALDVQIDVITPEERDMLVKADDGSDDEDNLSVDTEQKDDPADDDDLTSIAGTDKTGRNAAAAIYPSIESSIVSYFNKLDNVKDIEIFRKWLIANEKLYFDKWENEMDPNVKEPESQEYESAPKDNMGGGADSPPAESPAESPDADATQGLEFDQTQ